jgi:pimeloyl-ACP methyl ester carboxylesterase
MIEHRIPGELQAAQHVAASLDGIPIAFEVHGEGSPALVFIHGWSCDRSYWQAQVEPFAQEYRVITIDLAGHGESGLGRESWTMESFGEDVFAVLEKLAVERMVLIGHSMGGDVILEAARRLPGRVQALVWVDTYRRLPSDRSPGEIREKLAPFRADFASTARAFVRGMFHSNADASLVERVVSHMSSAPADVAISAASYAWSYGPKVDVALKELKLPLVAINPEKPNTDVESMQRYGIDVHLMPGVGHFLMMEDPKNFNELLAKVVRRFEK